MSDRKWQWFRAGGCKQVKLAVADDVANLAELDPKAWQVISMPVAGVRFDRRMLEMMDSDKDGRIRSREVLEAIAELKAAGAKFEELFAPSDADAKALAETLEKLSALDKLPPSEADLRALADWEAKGKDPAVAVLGAATAGAEAALKAAEPIVDAFFTPPEDMPLVTEEQDVTLPLAERINPRHQETILALATECVKPVLGERSAITRHEWKRLKAAFAPYRSWLAAKPVMNAGARENLEKEEKILRYKLHLLEFLENFVNLARLYRNDGTAIFQTGTLRIDGRELILCFDVENESAHAALAAKSNCCVLYLKLVAKASVRSVCAVVTAGTVGALYVGRNGVFVDRDGGEWEATVTKIVEAQVSLWEAFWSPWKKLGKGIADTVVKFIGGKQSAAQANLASGTKDAQSGAAAMASSVAAIGIGVGMAGAAVASIVAAIRGMGALQLALSVLAVIAVVSVPSVILAAIKLSHRDLGAILNAGGWAVNRPVRFSRSMAHRFTRSV